MLDEFISNDKNSKNDSNKNSRRYSVSIPCDDSVKSKLSTYFDHVNDMTTEFNQRSITDNDMYLINDALGISNSRHHFIPNFNED